MNVLLVTWVLSGLVAVVVAAVTLYLVRRRRTPKFDTYQPREYHSIEEAAKGLGPQQPGGVPLGY